MSFDIEKLYKENSEKTGPDMDKLWGRIEAGLDEQEKADTKTKPAIAHTRSRGLMRYIAVAACAVIAVTGAFIMLHNKSGKLETEKTNSISSSEAAAKSEAADGAQKSIAIADENEDEQNNDAEKEPMYSEDNTAPIQSIDADKSGVQKAADEVAEVKPEALTQDRSEDAAAEVPASDNAGSTGDSKGSSTQDPDERKLMEPEQAQEAVNDMTDRLVNSDEYLDADASRKAELAEEVFKKLYEQGAVISYTIETDPLTIRYTAAGEIEGIVSLV